MVGHTGDYNAIIKARNVDQCTKEVEAGLKAIMPLSLLTKVMQDFTANADGSPNTAHTTNLVQAFY